VPADALSTAPVIMCAESEARSTAALAVSAVVGEHFSIVLCARESVSCLGSAATFIAFADNSSGGNDITLDLACVTAGTIMGAIGGLATRLRLGTDGLPLGRAGLLAAGMWIAGVGARMAFAFAATHGAGPAIAAFSIAHHITGSGAWVAALVMMALADVLTRLAVVYLRGRRLAAGPRTQATPAAPATAMSVRAGAGA